MLRIAPSETARSRSIVGRIRLAVAVLVAAILIDGGLALGLNSWMRREQAHLGVLFNDYLALREYVSGLSRSSLGTMYFVSGESATGESLIHIGDQECDSVRARLRASAIPAATVDQVVALEWRLRQARERATSLRRYVADVGDSLSEIELRPKQAMLADEMKGIRALNDSIELKEASMQRSMQLMITKSEAKIVRMTWWVEAVMASLILASVLTGAAISLSAARAVSRPLTSLVGVARRIRDGDLDAKAVVFSDDEVGELAAVFNQMTSRLCDARLLQAEVEKREQMEVQLLANTRDLEDANRALAIASEEATAANTSKSEFLANMSHEIRTPMTAILGYADLLQEDDHSEQERHEYVRTIRRSGGHLLSVINDILDLSKIEAGKMTVEVTRCSLFQMVAEVLSTMRVRATGKGLRLDVEYVFPLPETIETDALRVRQILVNLVGNALKFTEQGHARVRVRSNAVSGGRSLVAVEIADTGIGMTAEQMGKLFRPFAQADGSTTRKYGGTGLGLTISKRLAEMLGGDIGVTSGIGEGSTFTATFATGSLEGVRMITNSCEAVLPSPENMANTPQVRIECRVLLAEDGPDNQRLISFLLRKAGAEVQVVEHGRLAIEAVEAAQRQSQPFNIVLMDMQMPEMDGYEATRELRRRGVRTPIVALTAHAMSGDREKCIAAGCDDFATKPIDRGALLRMCAHWLNAQRAVA